MLSRCADRRGLATDELRDFVTRVARIHTSLHWAVQLLPIAIAAAESMLLTNGHSVLAGLSLFMLSFGPYGQLLSRDCGIAQAAWRREHTA